MKRRTFISTTALATLGVTRLGRVTAQTKSKVTSPDVDAMLEVTKVPGVAVAGVMDGKPFELFAGRRESGKDDHLSAATIFPAASLSKPVFAWAVCALVKEGKLDWHRPLEDYLPLGLTGEAKKITAEHCLSHSTGLVNWRFQATAQLSSSFTPGSRWQYSGEGIFLLQRVVEKITGTPIAAYMKRQVLTPLVMTSSTYAWSPSLLANSITGHDSQGQPMERSLAFYERRNYDVLEKAGLNPEHATYEEIVAAYERAKAVALPVAMSPNMAGSLQTTAVDYGRFLAAVAADFPKRANDFTPRVAVNRKMSWTLGLGIDSSLRKPAFFHWGDGPGTKNLAWVQPARNLRLVFFTNGDRGAALYGWLLRTFTSEDPATLYWV
jgi:CubicO group peptidase (beta-lactamase class C family)